MSGLNGITAALTYNAIRRPSRNTGVSVNDYNSVMDSYEYQLKRAEKLKENCIAVTKKYDTLADNTCLLFSFINAERMANGKEMLTMGDIREIVNNNMFLSSFADKISYQSVNGDYSMASDETKFWHNIDSVVYRPLQKQVSSMGDAGKNAIMDSYDRNTGTLDGITNSKIEEMEKRIAELERNNRTLQEQNDKLVTQNRELKQQNMSFQEEAMNNMGIDLDAIVIPTFQPKQKETVEVKQNKGTISGSSHSPSN